MKHTGEQVVVHRPLLLCMFPDPMRGAKATEELFYVSINREENIQFFLLHIMKFREIEL